MHQNKPVSFDPRRCQHKEPMTVYGAREYYIGMVIIITFILGFFAYLLRNFVKESMWPDALIVIIWSGFPLFPVTGLFSNAKKQLRIAEEFKINGINVQGMIVDKWEWKGSSWEGYEGELYTFVGYNFSYLGRLWTGRKIADSSPYNKLQIGDCVTIRFLPSDPSISRMEDIAVKNYK